MAFVATSNLSFNPISNWTVVTQNDMLVSPPTSYWKPVVLDRVHMECFKQLPLTHPVFGTKSAVL